MYVSPRKTSNLWQRIVLPESITCCSRLEVHNLTLPLPGLEQPTRLLLFSDLHWPVQDTARLQALKDNFQRDPPDWLLFAGDLISFLEYVGPACEWLSTLPAQCGKIAVLGNRESVTAWHSRTFWTGIYGQCGFQCLINDALVPPSGPVFYGLDDCRFGRPEWSGCTAWKDSGRLVISLAHSPDTFAEAGSQFIGQLCLCGHTHGGQVRLPFWGPIYTSSMYGRQFVSGWRQRFDGTLCHISRGVGESGFGLAKRRFRCPPEILRLNLVPEQRKTGCDSDCT